MELILAMELFVSMIPHLAHKDILVMDLLLEQALNAFHPLILALLAILMMGQVLTVCLQSEPAYQDILMVETETNVFSQLMIAKLVLMMGLAKSV